MEAIEIGTQTPVLKETRTSSTVEGGREAGAGGAAAVATPLVGDAAAAGESRRPDRESEQGVAGGPLPAALAPATDGPQRHDHPSPLPLPAASAGCALPPPEESREGGG